MHGDFAKKEQTSEMSCLLQEDGLQKTMERKKYCAVDTVSPSATSIIDTCIGFMEMWDLTKVNLVYTEKTHKLSSDHNGAAWTAGELAGWRSETSKLKLVVK